MDSLRAHFVGCNSGKCPQFNCLLSGSSSQVRVIPEVFPLRAMHLDSPAFSDIPYTSNNEQSDDQTDTIFLLLYKQ